MKRQNNIQNQTVAAPSFGIQMRRRAYVVEFKEVQDSRDKYYIGMQMALSPSQIWSNLQLMTILLAKSSRPTAAAHLW